MKYKFLISAIIFIALIVPRPTQAQCTDFITVDGKKLKCGQNDFFAVVANYWVEVSRGPISDPYTYTYPNNYFPSRSHTYFTTNQLIPHIPNNAKADSAIRRDLRAIKAKGFNAIRVFGCGYQDTIKVTDWTGNNYIYIPFTDPNHTQLCLDIVGGVLKSAKAAGLKVIFLTGDDELGLDTTSLDLAFQAGYTNYLQEFGRRFGNDPTLLAVDFFNEPTVSGRAYWSKTKACRKTKEWNDALKLHSNALSTIGLWETGSAFWWDPNMLNVDFISLHNYPKTRINNQILNLSDAIDRVKSDYWWYKNNVKLPWIIGETGMTAHITNITSLDTACDRSPYPGTMQDQKTFLHETLNAARDFGATGYSWWEYCDESAGGYTCASNQGPFFGLVYSNDPTSAIVWKPAAQEITDFNPTASGSAAEPPNYYNYFNTPFLGHSTTGIVRLYNTTTPIQDAIVELMDSVPGIKGHNFHFTYTDHNGAFLINATPGSIMERVTVSATECEVVRKYNSLSSGSYYYLKKEDRPTANNLAYINSTVSSSNINSYANSYVTFMNYQINSSNFKTTAGNYINLQEGFSATSNTNFNAHIGPFYHDCSSFPFRKNNSDEKIDIPTVPLNEPDIKKALGGTNSIFPNPGTGNYQLNMAKEGNYQIEVYNMQGSIVRSECFTGITYKVDLQNEANGIYLFIIKNKNTILESVKIVKE